MFLVFALLSSVVIFSDRASTQEIKGEEKALIDKISSIIAQDVLNVNRRLPGAKNEEQERTFLKTSALKTSNTIQPLLDRLASIVSDPKNTRERIIQLIKIKTAAKAVESIDDKGDIQPRFLGNALSNIWEMSVNFVTSVFSF